MQSKQIQNRSLQLYVGQRVIAHRGPVMVHLYLLHKTIVIRFDTNTSVLNRGTTVSWYSLTSKEPTNYILNPTGQ